MSLRSFPSPKSPIHPLFKVGSSEVFVKREDRTFFAQGTKIRKLLGIYEYLVPLLKDGTVREIVLQGNLHSNAILASVLFFFWVGVPTKIVGYSRNRELVTPASLISKRFSELILFPTRAEWKSSVEVPTNSGQFLIPEYLFAPEALFGLESLWTEIPESGFDHIVVDTGSGLTWLSGLVWGKSPVHGICLGLSREKTIDWLRSRLPGLSPNIPELDWGLLIEPKEWITESFSFGVKNIFWKKKSAEYFRRFGIFFEPVYAAKSLAVIESFVKQGIWKGKILYIHQGGSLMGSPTDIVTHKLKGYGQS